MAKPMKSRLYLISPPEINLDDFTDMFEQALKGGDVACFQLRLKNQAGEAASDENILTSCHRLIPIAHAHNVAFLVNDRPDIAKQAGADGVHIGQDDMPYTETRNLLGENAIIGVTCHDSRHLAMVASEAGADYVAFGAFYPTQTKTPKFSADKELLSWWQETMEPPCVAIGGITIDNAEPLLEAGADFIAVSSGIWNYVDGPQKAVKAFNKLMDT